MIVVTNAAAVRRCTQATLSWVHLIVHSTGVLKLLLPFFISTPYFLQPYFESAMYFYYCFSDPVLRTRVPFA